MDRRFELPVSKSDMVKILSAFSGLVVANGRYQISFVGEDQVMFNGPDGNHLVSIDDIFSLEFKVVPDSKATQRK